MMKQTFRIEPGDLLRLKRAKARIERYGWIQARFGDHKQGFCLVGSFPIGDYPPQALRQALPGTFKGDLIQYNDHPRRTKRQILALFDKAIRLVVGATSKRKTP